MKKLDEIKGRRQTRFFERRMAMAKAKKRQDIENELVKHADLITDSKVKAFISIKREEKRVKLQAKWDKQGPSMRKDVKMVESESEEESEEELQTPQVIKNKNKKMNKAGKMSKVIKKKWSSENISPLVFKLIKYYHL